MRELAAQKAVPHRDFYNVRKVSGNPSLKDVYLYIHTYVFTYNGAFFKGPSDSFDLSIKDKFSGPDRNMPTQFYL